MTKIIHKYILDKRVKEFFLPRRSKILHVGNQFNNICIWVLLNTEEEETDKVVFYTHGTGFELPDDPGEYLGTVPLENGMFIWHVFGKKEKHEKTM